MVTVRFLGRSQAMTVQGIDLSNWNDVIPPLDGLGFVIHKATQGNSFVDKYYRNRHSLIREWGYVWGAYLFPQPDVTVQSQLDHFRRVADIQPGDIVALDFEDYISGGRSVWNRYGFRTIAHMGGDLMLGLREMYPDNRVILYCNVSTYQLVVQPYGVPLMDGLWIAAPDQTPNMDWVFWQYKTSPVDTNRSVFETIDSLREWAGMDDMPSAEEIVQAFMRHEIKVRVAHVAVDGEEQEYWTSSVENMIGSVWGQVFNATGEYGPSLAGGLNEVLDVLDDVKLAVVQNGNNPELLRLFQRFVTAFERLVGDGDA